MTSFAIILMKERGMRLNKDSLVDSLATKLNRNKYEIKIFLNALFETITEELKLGNEINWYGFGKFIVQRRSARKVVSPHSIHATVIPLHLTPRFVAGKTFKRQINKLE